jgi:hypothetical protein
MQAFFDPGDLILEQALVEKAQSLGGSPHASSPGVGVAQASVRQAIGAWLRPLAHLAFILTPLMRILSGVPEAPDLEQRNRTVLEFLLARARGRLRTGAPPQTRHSPIIAPGVGNQRETVKQGRGGNPCVCAPATFFPAASLEREGFANPVRASACDWCAPWRITPQSR